MTEKCKPGIGKRDTVGERRADEKHGRGFSSTLGGEAGSRIFRFAKHVRHFILAADIRKAFDLSGACGRQEHGSTGSELGLHVSHAGCDIAVKTRAGARGEFELRRGPNSQRELLDMNLRSFCQCRRKFLFRPKVMRGSWRVGASVTFVVFCSGFEMLFRSLA